MNHQNTISAELESIAPSLIDINKMMPQQLPFGYFEIFAEKILALAKLQSVKNEVDEELEEIAPLLNQISKKSVNFIPQGYFESFRLQLPKKQSNSIKMPTIRKWMTYAAAAIVAGILVTTGFLYTNKSNHSFDYERYSKIDIPTSLNNLSENELETYLSSPSSLTISHAYVDPELTIDTENNFEHIADDEMLQYLNESGEKVIKKTS